MAKARKVHLVLNNLSICRKFVFWNDLMDGMSKADQIKRGATINEKEVTCEWCIEKILLGRYKAGLIKL